MKTSLFHPGIKSRLSVGLTCFALLLFVGIAQSDEIQERLVQESRTAIEGADPFMGDWQGSFKQRNRKTTTALVAQVVALGKGRYHATLLREFDKRTTPVASLEGLANGDAVQFYGWGDLSSYLGPDWEGKIEGGKFIGGTPSREGGTFEMVKVVRISPTLGAQPPAGAVVLFNGSNLDEWERRGRLLASPAQWNLLPNGAMEIGKGANAGSISTKKKFGDYRLHIEFATPFMPEAREQSRGNSGVYCHGIETQVLDSYGLVGRSKECGGLYNGHDPLVNMCRPPLQWQTYDITFRTPGDGKNTRLTVEHNGVVVHDNLDVGRKVQPAVIQLQDHGNAARYRNIWLVEAR